MYRVTFRMQSGFTFHGKSRNLPNQDRDWWWEVYLDHSNTTEPMLVNKAHITSVQNEGFSRD